MGQRIRFWVALFGSPDMIRTFLGDARQSGDFSGLTILQAAGQLPEIARWREILLAEFWETAD